jgi:hypothetical protein
VSYITVDAAAVLDDLNLLLRQARELMDPSASAYLESRRRHLMTALATPDLAQPPFDVPKSNPLKTGVSREHKGLKEGVPTAGGVRAELTFEWELTRDPDNARRFRINRGGVNVAFLSAGGNELRSFHYDACRGGVDGQGGIAQHPFAHFQYSPVNTGNGVHSSFGDLPRLPSLLFSPVDVLEQVLLDLWPIRWPAILGGQQARRNLVHHHATQKARLATAADRFVSAAKTHHIPLRGLQMRLAADLPM